MFLRPFHRASFAYEDAVTPPLQMGQQAVGNMVHQRQQSDSQVESLALSDGDAFAIHGIDSVPRQYGDSIDGALTQACG